MSNKTKKVSINQFEKALHKNNTVDVILDGTDDVEFTINKTLNIQDAMAFVSGIVESCINGEDVEYIPEAYDFALRVNVITYYTNLSLPSSMEKKYDLMYSTNVFGQVIDNIDKGQFEALKKAADQKIEYIVGTMSSMYASQINEIINAFNELITSNEELSKNVDPEIISELVSKMNIKNTKQEENTETVIVER